jgi:hypothetical protein
MMGTVVNNKRCLTLATASPSCHLRSGSSTSSWMPLSRRSRCLQQNPAKQQKQSSTKRYEFELCRKDRNGHLGVCGVKVVLQLYVKVVLQLTESFRAAAAAPPPGCHDQAGPGACETSGSRHSTGVRTDGRNT